MEEKSPAISVIICTRNRGAQIVTALDSVLANTHPSYTVIVVDQSTDALTAAAVQPYLQDPRVRYIPTDTKGSSIARNIGAQATGSELLLFTDDDCVVPTNWLEGMQGALLRHPEAGLAYCCIQAAPYDPALGYTPDYICKDEFLIRKSWEKRLARGMSAGMAARAAVFRELDGFDIHLGPGSRHWSSEDMDIAVRSLIAGWSLVITDCVSVTHYGFRNKRDARRLAKRDWMGIGAMYSKVLRSGHREFLKVVLFETFYLGLLKPLSRLFSLKKPVGLRNFLYFWMGFFQSARAPIDKDRVLYLPIHDAWNNPRLPSELPLRKEPDARLWNETNPG